MLISPAEPPQLRKLGRTSSTPENYGADFLIHSPVFGLVGVQRKELGDLVNSISGTDDRFAREVIQMKELDWAVWLLEGRESWNSDGQALWTRGRYTRSQHLGLQFTLLSQGFSLIRTDTLNDTGELLSAFNRWAMKDEHKGITGRGTPRGEWGKADQKEWQVHFLQGLPGMGAVRSQAVVEHFGGLPLVLIGDLSQVPGIGKGTAKRVEELFNGDD